ncbi:MAG TPA: uridine kinase [Spirochaetota bacterium]|nr:uridine kinase [Spirochaetota bacterium]HPI91343.1 uridine kinase [Spirochaetota bacterium]HPR50060.1 uridine kinase [Spirochaetota bacterium]
MALIREKDGKRLHIKSRLMGESLVSRSFFEELEKKPQRRLFPDINILKIGGQSISDRGARALPGIIEEIGENRERHKMLITTGGGTRSRHIYSLGIELGMPTGIMGKFGSAISEQNALLVATLLAGHGGILVKQEQIMELQLYYEEGAIPVMPAMPPYDYFSIPSKNGRIPMHRTDSGTLILADLIGARSCILVKDEKGLYTDDPKKNPAAEFIPRISVSELRKRDLDDLIIERPCLEIMENSEVIEKVQIINGLEKGSITRALDGEEVGTVIYKK